MNSLENHALARGKAQAQLRAPQFEKRFYRVQSKSPGLARFEARVKETDLFIQARHDLSKQAVESILKHRRVLEAYLAQAPRMEHALTPWPSDPYAPELVAGMISAGQATGTGPMAAVAGAIAQAVASDLLELSPVVLVENGGDLYLAADRDLTVAVWAGDSPLTGRLGLGLAKEQMPIGLATSSATVGHSLSAGRADAAVILSKDAALADAAATALGNRVQDKGDMEAALNWAAALEGVDGALVVLGEHLAAWGGISLVELS